MKPQYAKFAIGQIVTWENEFNFNPCSQVRSFGKIQVIHEFHGETLFKDRSLAGEVEYAVSGSNLILREKDLTAVEEN